MREWFPTAAAVTLALVVLTLLTGCFFAQEEASEEVVSVVHERANGTPHLVDGSFGQLNGRFRYGTDSFYVDRTGVDVSDHQDDIDWEAVAADGISFALIRVGYRGSTEGGLFVDEHFETNLRGAREAGLACGVYFYSQAISVEEAKEEAAFVLEQLDGRPLEYPITFDYEVVEGTRAANVDHEVITQAAQAFCEEIRAAGYEPMLYGNAYDLSRLGGEVKADYPIWFAEYDDDPSYTGEIRIWQYTSQGSVRGIAEEADLNLDLSGAYE